MHFLDNYIGCKENYTILSTIVYEKTCYRFKNAVLNDQFEYNKLYHSSYELNESQMNHFYRNPRSLPPPKSRDLYRKISQSGFFFSLSLLLLLSSSFVRNE